MNRSNGSTNSPLLSCVALTFGVVAIMFIAGCAKNRGVHFDKGPAPISPVYNQIETPKLCDTTCDSLDDFLTVAPTTIRNFHSLEALDLTLDDCIRRTLTNSAVLTKLGGVVVNSPQGARTIYDQAILNTSLSSTEAALSDFDAQYSFLGSYNRSEQGVADGSFLSFLGLNSQTSRIASLDSQLRKTAATGSTFTLRNRTDYNKFADGAQFPSVWNTVFSAELRQPLLRGAGTAVNRIAGPNAFTGVYDGVLIARIREDISLADFEASVRNLVIEVVRNYWELYYAYRDLDARITARDSARETWAYRRDRKVGDIEGPEIEAAARQQYFSFQNQAENALSGGASGTTGVLGAERQLRRLMGMPAADGKLIRPISEPTNAPIIFDWDSSQQTSLQQRVEIRRQKWNVKQRELELFASRNLRKWQVDLLASYGARGFGDDLFGQTGSPAGQGSAFADVFRGTLDEWQVGIDIQRPVGNRLGHLGVRNAELALVREKALLREQKKQVLLDLAAAYTEVDRSFSSIKITFNNRVATFQELTTLEAKYKIGESPIFFYLDAKSRYTNVESLLYRTIADYNIALATFAFNRGDLLQQFNISLSEGPWNEAAVTNADRNASRFLTDGLEPKRMDVGAISNGPVNPTLLIDDQSAIEQPADEKSPAGDPKTDESPIEEPAPAEPPPVEKSAPNPAFQIDDDN